MSAMYGSSPAPVSPSSPTASSEKSIKSCYAVVYELKDRKWAVSGEGGWSEVHLCHDTADNSHRILAWTVKNQNVLMNCNVTGECSYKEKSKNFHSFTDENKNRFGLGFHKSDSGLRQAQHFLNATVTVIKESKNNDLAGFSLGNGSGPPPNPFEANKGNSYNNSHHSKPLPPSPNQNQNNMINNNNNNNNNYNSNCENNSYENDNQSSHHSGMPKPPPFMSGSSSSSHQNGNGNGNGNGNKVGSASPRGKSPPPNPYQKSPKSPQGQQAQMGQGQGQVQGQVQAPPPTFSAYSQAKPQHSASPPAAKAQVPQPPPSQNYPQLQKPQSPYQSTTENVSLSPVQAAVNGDNEQKQASQASQPRSPHMEDNLPKYHLNNKQTKSLPSEPIGPLGALKILPPKPTKLQGGDKKILNPDKVEHMVRVVHNKDTGEFHGLPQEWVDALNKQFGVKPHLLPSVKLQAYTHKIPKVLITLRQKLEDANAYEQVGIFRLAPNATDNKNMKATIDKGKFDSDSSVDLNVYANLIKVWFRDLPDPLLNCVDPTMIEMAQKEEDVIKVVSKFPEPQKSIFEWLCDMCCECAKYENVNKMGPQNLAIVIGPNLFNTDNFENPMKAMTFSGKVVQFFKLAIENRQKVLASHA